MLLMLDYGIFYEFIPLDELDKESRGRCCCTRWKWVHPTRS